MTKKCIFWSWKENQRNKIEVPDPNRGMIQSAMKYSLKRKTRYSLLLAPSVVFYVVRGPPRGGGGGGNEIPMCKISSSWNTTIPNCKVFIYILRYPGYQRFFSRAAGIFGQHRRTRGTSHAQGVHFSSPSARATHVPRFSRAYLRSPEKRKINNNARSAG